MTTKLSGPMVPPRDGVAKRLVVLLHGYGSDGADLIGLVGAWRDLLPDALFLAPNGPEPCGLNPAGYQWFALERDDPDYRVAGAGRARPVLIEFLRDLWVQSGLTARDTLLIGFSQGAMMALHVALALDQSVMGVVAFSGALIAPPDFDDNVGPKSPICLVHGAADQVVDAEMSEFAATILRGKGFDVLLQIEPGAPHTITPRGLDFASRFIAAVSAIV